jgi:hypothetical protein
VFACEVVNSLWIREEAIRDLAKTSSSKTEIFRQSFLMPDQGRPRIRRYSIPITVDFIVSEVLGKSFEFSCYDMRIEGWHDSGPPLLAGPGTISGTEHGAMTYTLFDQGAFASQAQAVSAIEEGRTKNEPFRLVAQAHNGIEWVGHWHFPFAERNSPKGTLVSGEVSQLCALVEGPLGLSYTNQSRLYYSERFRLPFLSSSETVRSRDGTIQYRQSRLDAATLNLNDAQVAVEDDEQQNTTVVSCIHAPSWPQPCCESSLANAINFMHGVPSRPRIWVRALADRAHVFVRTSKPGFPTGMLPPIWGTPELREAFWGLFGAFLMYSRGHGLEVSPLERITHEIISASTGTVHAFIVSIALAIEGLAKELVPNAPTDSGVPDDLLVYLQNWTGPSDTVASAIRRLKSGPRPKTERRLQRLQERGIVTAQQVSVWQDVRHPIAHGDLTDYDDKELFQKRDTLITMFYRLALAIIGYRGKAMDYSVSPRRPFDFNWTE